MKKCINYLFASKKTFAKGVCFQKLFFFFIIGCVFGCVWEETLEFFVQYSSTGTFHWITRRGLIYGELSPVYGFGAALIVYLLNRRERSWYKNYLYGALIGGGFEYFANFLQEILTGAVSWDYSHEFMNINGRTTIPFMLVWGLLALLFVYIIYLFISSLIEKIPYNLGMIIFYILFILVAVDMFISIGAVARQVLRRYGYHPLSPVGEFFDYFYPDERIAQVYNNAVLK